MNAVRYEAHPAMFRNNPLLFILAVILIPVGVGILILLGWYIQCKATKVTVEENEVILQRGILSKDRIELRLRDVRTVRLKQSFMQRIFGTGNIEVYTAGDSPEITAAGMPEPQRLHDLISGD